MKFFDAANRADAIITMPPSDAGAAELAELVKSHDGLLVYLLDKVDGPWLARLVDRGWLESGEDQAPKWWAYAKAVERVATTEEAEAATPALLAMPIVDHVLAVRHLVQAAVKLAGKGPEAFARRWLPWFSERSSLDMLDRPLWALTVRLLRDGSATGWDLATVLLAPLEGQRSSSILDAAPTRVTPYWYRECVKGVVGELSGRQGFYFLLTHLDRLIAASLPRGRADDGREYWFSRERRHARSDQRRVLAEAVLSSARGLWTEEETQAEVALALASFRWGIGTDLLLRLLIDSKAPPIPMVRALVERTELWDEVTLEPLDRRLLTTAANALAEDDVDRLLARIRRGPSQHHVRIWKSRASAEVDIAAYSERWRRERLSAMPSHLLNPTDVAALEQWPPVDAEDGASLDPEPRWESLGQEEVLALLQSGKWPSNLDPMMEHHLTALLSAALNLSSDDTPSRASELLFAVVRMGGEKVPSEAWPTLLELCRVAVATGAREPTRWAARVAAIAVEPRGDDDLPHELAAQVWAVIQAAGDHHDPTGVSDYGRPFEQAINAPRTLAIEAAVRYAQWEKRLAQEPGSWRIVGHPLLAGFLDAQLADERASAAVHAMFGNWLPWLVVLDEKWVEERLQVLLPPGQDERWLFEPAWANYLRHLCYDRVFDLLRPVYERSVADLAPDEDFAESDVSWQAGVARHLMAQYWRGRLALDGPILQTFYSNASPRLRAYTVEFVGRSLAKTDDLPPELGDRLMRLREARQASLNSQQDPEIAAIGEWALAAGLPVGWRIAQVTAAAHVGSVERAFAVKDLLVEACGRHPVACFHALQALLKHDSDRVSHWVDDWAVILEQALACEEVRDEAEALVHELGERGHWDLRALLAAL